MPGKIEAMANTRKFSKKVVILALVIILVIASGLVYAIKHKHRETIPTTTTNSAAKKTQTSKSGGKVIPAANGSPNGSDNSKGSSPASATLQTPFGTFVSNHRPNLGSSSSEESVCITTPRASCYIEFTNGNTVKQLPVQTADASGSVYWSWDVKQAGLGAGKWQIKAVASLNGQTKNAQDNLGLDVSQ